MSTPSLLSSAKDLIQPTYWQDDVLNWQDFCSLLNQPAYIAFWLEENSEWIGHILLQIAGDNAEIITIQVDKVQQGKGYGNNLLTKALAYTKANDTQKILLDVRPDNLPAQALYAKFGAQKIAERKNYYQNPTADAWVYEIHFAAP